jgi:DNA-directed RNA polymerase subunit RPC12/RpoP
MGRFREKMYRFMYGRYGTDALYNFLTWLNVILILLSFIAAAFIEDETVNAIVSVAFSAVITFIFIYEIYRMMSRNIAKRRRENERYLRISGRVKRFLSGNTSKRTKTFNRDDAAYIFRDCTKCQSTLRLPRRVGKHKVRCPRCSHSFYVVAKKYKDRNNRY